MEGGPPFGSDEMDFDFESSRQRRWESETGERPAAPGPEADEPPAGEPPSEEHREETGERRAGTDEHADPFDTGERRSGTDEYEDPFDASERRARRRERPRRGLRLPKLGRRRSGGGRRDRARVETEAGERRLEDDPYTPAEVGVSSLRRRRHRDLPANVRRRQAGLVGIVALAVLVGVFLLAKAIFGGGGDDEEQPLPLKKLVGQTIIGKLGKADPDRELLRRVRKGQIGGVIATAPRDEQTLATQVAQLQQAAAEGGNPQLLVLIDQEGGDVKRLPGPPNLAPPELGEAGADAARTAGEETGTYLKTAGVNVDLAPVLDVELPQSADSIASRTFGEDAAVVSEVGSAFIEGLQPTGVAATAKHFPGLGPATLNTDDSPVTIVARDETLQAALQPFQAAVDSGVELVMVSSAIYPAYGPENPRDPNRPASSVKAIVQGLLRDQLGFKGVIVTDDLQSVAIETLTDSTSAGIAALGAGCDLLLYAGSKGGSQDGFDAVVRAARKRKLSRGQLQAAYDRITSLKTLLASTASSE